MAKRGELRGDERLLHPRNEGHDEEREAAQRRHWREQQDPRLPEQRLAARPGSGPPHETRHETSRDEFEPRRELPSGEGRWSTGGEPKRAGKADENAGRHRAVGASPPADDQAFHRHRTGTKPQATTGEAMRRYRPPED
ncbi:MAG: hypothetical protein ACOZNI_29420 [Myxococcota bacterium]